MAWQQIIMRATVWQWTRFVTIIFYVWRRGDTIRCCPFFYANVGLEVIEDNNA